LVSHDYLVHDSGRIRCLNVDRRKTRAANVTGYQLFNKPGDTVITRQGDGKYIGWIMTKGKTHTEAKENLKKAIPCVQCRIEPLCRSDLKDFAAFAQKYLKLPKIRLPRSRHPQI
jgi:hypothetical protein